MPSLDEVLAGGWDFECQGLDEPTGERWKQYRSRMQPLLVKLTRWSDADGTLVANEYLFDGQSFDSAAEAVGASRLMPEPSAEISKEKAQEALFGIHDAWNARDIERFLSFCVDDLAFWINDRPGGGLILFGKEQVGQRLRTWDAIEFTFRPARLHLQGWRHQSQLRIFDEEPCERAEFCVRPPPSHHVS